MENHPFNYDIDYIQPGVVHFEDNIDSSFYLIEGRDKALLIDTGCGGGNIHRLASAFTDKPIELAVTHDHGDHDAHAMEFSKVYTARTSTACAKSRSASAFRKMSGWILRTSRPWRTAR